LIRLSKTIIDQVVESKQAILSTDTMDDPKFQLSESIADFRIRSFICAPLIDAEGTVLGAIQLDSLDHRNRFRPEDLDLLASVAGQAGIAIDNAQLHDRVVRQRVLERDLELASEVQKSFLPQRAPSLENYELNHFYQPADKVGGDYVDYISLPDGRVAVVLADVVGHGMAAALQTAQLSAALKFSLATNTDPAEAVRSLNETLSDGSLEDRFITFCMLVIHSDSAKISIVNAGHMPPLLCRGDEVPVELGAEVRGVPLLVLDMFPYEAVEVTLEDGDLVLMYTDGLNEAMNAEGELYGTDRLLEQSKGVQSGVELTERLVEDIRDFSGGMAQKDDMCLVCCERGPSRTQSLTQ
jgi:serine phosphatase RsbU (regulator of sigma subunit)